MGSNVFLEIFELLMVLSVELILDIQVKVLFYQFIDLPFRMIIIVVFHKGI